LGNSIDKFRHTRSVAYSVELVLLNKHQISDGGAYLHCYQILLQLMIPYQGFAMNPTGGLPSTDPWIIRPTLEKFLLPPL